MNDLSRWQDLAAVQCEQCQWRVHGKKMRLSGHDVVTGLLVANPDMLAAVEDS